MDSVGILNVKVKSNFGEFLRQTEAIKRNLSQIQSNSFNNLFKNTGIEDFNRELKNFDKNTKSLFNFSKSSSALRQLSGVGKTLTRSVTAPTMIASAFLGKQEANIEHELNNISALLEGDYKKKRSDIKKWSKEISDETGLSWKEVLKGSYQGLQSGVKIGDLKSMLGTSALLGKVGGDETTTENAMDLLTTYMNAYGLSSKQAEKLAGQFFKTQLRGKVTIAELAESMGDLALMANKLGVEIPESLGMVSALTAQGFDVKRVTTGINSIFNSIIKPTDDTIETVKSLNEYLKSMGKQEIDFSVKGFKEAGLKNWLKQVISATGGSEELLGKLFPNIRATKIVTGLSSANTWNNYDKFSKEISTANLDTVTEAFERMKGPFFELKKAWNSFKNTILEKGMAEQSISSLTDLLKKLKSIIDNMSNKDIKLFSQIAIGAAILGPILRLIGGFGLGIINVGQASIWLGKTLSNSLGITGIGAVAALTLATAGLLGALNNIDGKVQDITDKFDYMTITGKNSLEAGIDKLITQLDGAWNKVQGLTEDFHSKAMNIEAERVKRLTGTDPKQLRQKAEDKRKQSEKTKEIGQYKLTRPTDYMTQKTQDGINFIKACKKGDYSNLKIKYNYETDKNGIMTDESLKELKENMKKVEPPKVTPEIEEIKKAKEEIQNLKKTTTKNEDEGQKVLDGFKKFQEEQAKRQEQIGNTQKDINNKKLEEQRIVKSLADENKRNTDELKKQLTIGEKINKSRVSVGKLLRIEKKKAEMAQNFKKMQNELSGKIGNKEILKDIKDLGFEGYGKVEALSRMTKAQLNDFINSRLITNKVAEEMATYNQKIDITVNADSQSRATDIAQELKREFERRGISLGTI